MKKWLAIIMTTVMILGMPMLPLTVKGEEITLDSREQSGKININYNMEVSYTVTIPASVTFTDTEKNVERSLLAKDVLLNEGSSLNVIVSSLNNFQMKNGDSYIDYSLLINQGDVLKDNDSTILTVLAGENSGWAIVNFVTDLNKENALYAGNYIDTLTFTVTID